MVEKSQTLQDFQRQIFKKKTANLVGNSQNVWVNLAAKLSTKAADFVGFSVQISLESDPFGTDLTNVFNAKKGGIQICSFWGK